MYILSVILGLGLLVGGAELLVRGSSRLAALFGISPLVIGLTVVAFGTSAPELAVSVRAALAENPGIAVGNVVGSNILNVLLILGIAAWIVPLSISRQLIRLDVPLMIAASLLVLLFGMNGVISALEGGVLFAGLLAYTLFLIRKSRNENKQENDEFEREYASQGSNKKLRDILFVIGGLAMLIVGADRFVDGAVQIARSLGVGELLIGLTVVALGTSMPELVTSVVAASRGERDIAVGNIVGSNIFNILGVLGLTGMVSVSGIPVEQVALRFDIPVMIAVALICLPVFLTGRVISRKEGFFFVTLYVAYTAYLLRPALES